MKVISRDRRNFQPTLCFCQTQHILNLALIHREQHVRMYSI